MKKFSVVLSALLLVAGIMSSTFAADSKAKTSTKAATPIAKNSDNLDSYMDPGSFAASMGVGFGYYYGLNLAFYPGVELGIAQIKIADTYPINFGIAARGFYSSYSYTIFADYTLGYTYFGAGVYGVGHFSLKYLKLGAFWDKLDTYAGLGVAFYAGSPTGTYWDYYKKYYGSDYTGANSGGIGFASYGGTSYYLTDNFAVFAEGNYFSYMGNGTVGILYKF